MTHDEYINRFIRGLKSRIATEVQLKHQDSFDTAMLFACDEAVYSYQTRYSRKNQDFGSFPSLLQLQWTM